MSEQNKELQKLQLQINTIDALSRAFTDGKASVTYDKERKCCVVTKKMYDSDGNSEVKTFFMTPRTIHEFIDVCDAQMIEAKEKFDAAKIAKTHAESLYVKAKELEQAAVPSSIG